MGIVKDVEALDRFQFGGWDSFYYLNYENGSGSGSGSGVEAA